MLLYDDISLALLLLLLDISNYQIKQSSAAKLLESSNDTDVKNKAHINVFLSHLLQSLMQAYINLKKMKEEAWPKIKS